MGTDTLVQVTQASITDLREVEAWTWQSIADYLGLGSESSARRAYAREKKAQNFEPKNFERSPQSGILNESLRPLAVELPAIPEPVDVDVYRVLLYGDTHFPFHSPEALDVVKQIGLILDPTHVIHMGDLLDCYHWSRFEKNPDRIHTVQDEIDDARVHLTEMRLACPRAQFYLLEGNHEWRLERTLWELEGPARALLTLTKARELLTMPALLGLAELGVTWVPEKEQTKIEILPKLVLKHGTVVRKWSGATAKGEWERYGRSGASGHVHRLAAFWHGKHGGGAHTWVETGCTCTLEPEYMLDPDWQQGCVVLTIEKDRGTVSPEMVYIKDGRAAFRGQILEAA